MDQEYTNADRPYGSYEGSSHYYTRSQEEAAQKLNVDSDEQFDDLLVRRIKRELLEELKQTASSSDTPPSSVNGSPLVNIELKQTGQGAKGKNNATPRGIGFAIFASVTFIIMAGVTVLASAYAYDAAGRGLVGILGALLLLGFMFILYVAILWIFSFFNRWVQ
ncbi:MAG TPA: hypothetical protein VHV10_12015 [Ktedonobacteraceae bacterium]|nr:hypothetical protein [Ktedonobacteraceae bacterium]